MVDKVMIKKLVDKVMIKKFLIPNSKFLIVYMFMLKKIAILIITAVSVSCSNAGDIGDFCIEAYTPEYASGFVIMAAEGRASTILMSKNPWQGADGVTTELFIARNGEVPPSGFRGEVLTGEPSRIVCLSSTHIAMLDAVGAVERVVGVSGADYVTNEYVTSHRDTVGDVGYEGNIDYELMVALDPDVVLLYGIGGTSGMEGRLRELGIPFAYIGDYLEESPLGRAEWLVAVGEIAGCREYAATVFAEIPERYAELKRRAAAAESKRPAVMVNTPYGDAWIMSPTTSGIARMIADAGGRYVYEGNTTDRSLPIDMEEAALLVSQADIWLNVGNISTLAELQRSLPRFADARCVGTGNVWNCNRRTNAAGGNDYWESGIVRPDVILSDLVKIFHPELLPDRKLYYYRHIE